MKNFDYKKYLAEGKLYEESIPSGWKKIDTSDEYEEEDEQGRLMGFEAPMNGIKGDEVDNIYIEQDEDEFEVHIMTAFNNPEYKGPFNSKEEALKVAIQKMEDLKKDWDEGLAEGKLLNEFVGKELEDRNQPFYDKLVAGSGKSDTIEGEMLRAINRIVYRYYNDGDEYHTGYGTETAGPAHSFLVNANHPLKSLVSNLFKKGTNYEQTIKDVLEAILDHIESKQGKYSSNSEDMFDYKSEFEDDEYEEEDYEDDYDEFDNEEQF